MHCYWNGRWDEALETADQFLRDAAGGPGHYMEAACHWARAAIWSARGRRDDGLAAARLCTERARAIGDPQVLQPGLALGGRLLLDAGNRRQSEELADELLQSWRSIGLRYPLVCTEGARLFRGLGRAGDLLATLDQVRVPSLWHMAARHVAEGDLAAAAETYAKIGTIPDEAYARLQAAAAFVAAGDRNAADRELALASPVFVQLGATAWRAEASSLLAESA